MLVKGASSSIRSVWLVIQDDALPSPRHHPSSFVFHIARVTRSRSQRLIALRRRCSRRSTYVNISPHPLKHTHLPETQPINKTRRYDNDSRNIQEPILVLVLLIDRAHERGRRRKHLIHEDEDGLLRGELDALADDVDELADGQVRGDEVLLLVNGRDVGFFDFFADDL